MRSLHCPLSLFRLLALVFIFRGARRTGRALTALGAVLLGLGGCGATSALIDHAQRSLAGDHTDRADLVAVIDADTIAVEIKGSEHRVRLLGIDAPEGSRTRYGKPSCGAKQARALLVHLLFGVAVDGDDDGLADSGTDARAITLTSDRSQDNEDRYGRLLRYVNVRGQRRTAQQRLLQAGWAKVYVLEGDFQRVGLFREAQRSAERHRRGVYRMCAGNFNTAKRS
jgi:endonuclease YncB( thermonuclease family)